MPKVKPFALVALLFALIPLNEPAAADAAGFNQFVGLGDSNLDSGYFRYHTTGIAAADAAVAAAVAGGAAGGFAGNGVVSSVQLAGRFGLSAAPIGGGGTNYAIGGSYVAVDTPVLVSAVRQIRNYLASVNGAANPDALYVIKSGDNDLTYVTNQGAAWIAANPGYLNQQASALAAEIAALQAAGARTIIIPNSVNYGVSAALGGGLDPANAAAYARSVAYGSALWSDLAAAGVNFIPADIDSVIRYVVKNPTLFGFTAASVFAANAPSPVSALVSILTPAQQQGYLFIDGKHLTTAGQTIVADYEYSLLIAPSQMSLLAESAVRSGLARVTSIQGQIDLSGERRETGGFGVWTTAGAAGQRIKNASSFPDLSGTPYGGTVGLDYRTTGGVLLGVAITAGGQRQEFSTGGHFDRTDEAASLYAAYRTGPVWGSAAAVYGRFQDRITRPVPLGTFVDENSARTRGNALALALRGGCDFRLGRITTGPVAGVVAQQVNVEGFTETGMSGVTALSFGSQTQDSRVSRLGWRVSADLGRWRPFAEAEWNHEMAGRGRTVTAALTSVAAPSFTVDAVPAAEDWATASLGASYAFGSRFLLRGVASALFLNPQVRSFGGELSLSVSF
ncbi:MAG: autotransporter domain-containing protein [Desulfobacteraceae bacterium]|nr:MAG: autotransporter domain-containing protein [Desulfobacteraceae bacterium]